MPLSKMASNFHHNAILTGYVDSYCLVCESHLRGDADMKVHIIKPIHIKNLDAAAYVEKYKDDHVRKVKKGYFCEFCNLLNTTVTKVALHVAESIHITNKGIQCLKRFGNFITAFDDVLIDEKAWNGLIDFTCAICNIEFDNEGIHKTAQSHILNLVQFKVEFSSDNTIYRKIDDISFQCLTCNSVLAISSMQTHSDTEIHKNRYLKCQNTYYEAVHPKNTPVDDEQSKPIITKFEDVAAKETIKALLNESAQEIPEEPETAEKRTDIKKPASVELKCNGAAKKGNNNQSKVDKSLSNLKTCTRDMDEAICQLLNTKDYVTKDEKDQRWCLLCHWTVEGDIFKKHVTGRHHQTMLKMHKERIQKKQQQEDKRNATKVTRDITKYHNDRIKINPDTCVAFCTMCSQNIAYDYDTIEQHVVDHDNDRISSLNRPVTTPTEESAKPPEGKEYEKYYKVEKKGKKKREPLALPTERDNELDDTPPFPESILVELVYPGAESRASSAVSKEVDEEVDKFAKENDLVPSQEDNKMYCCVCDSKVPSSFKNLKEHVNGLAHKNKVAKMEANPNRKVALEKQILKEFLDKIAIVEKLFVKDLVVNDKYCINTLSFMTITKEDGKTKCEVCEVEIEHNEHLHMRSSGHEQALFNTQVITSWDTEFVREIRPEMYHCGFCNIMVTGLPEVERHLVTNSHRESKSSGFWRRTQYAPVIQRNQQQRTDLSKFMKILVDNPTY